ncbi:hypothetical protein EV361DRAFT_159614 [Lentinula raphanica]|nr:hypothetical protein EV361DRAFT_159614 [Lentinula raphanica]
MRGRFSLISPHLFLSIFDVVTVLLFDFTIDNFCWQKSVYRPSYCSHSQRSSLLAFSATIINCQLFYLSSTSCFSCFLTPLPSPSARYCNA